MLSKTSPFAKTFDLDLDLIRQTMTLLGGGGGSKQLASMHSVSTKNFFWLSGPFYHWVPSSLQILINAILLSKPFNFDRYFVLLVLRCIAWFPGWGRLYLGESYKQFLQDLMACCASPWIAWGNFLSLFPLSLNVCAILSPVVARAKQKTAKGW